MLSAIGAGGWRVMTMRSIGAIPPSGRTAMASGEDAGGEDRRRRVRQMRVREATRALGAPRAPEHDRGRPEFRRPRPVRVWR